MILTDHVDHRPFPLPDAPWLMHQAWNDFLFMHWRVDPTVIRALVPEQLELHLHDGACYVGIIPFHMSDVRPRGTLNVPGISAFPELNVRTYVIVDGRPGVWFLSLDAHQRLAVETARATYDLPYYQAKMSWDRRGTTLHYDSERTDGRAPSARYRGHHTPRGEYRMARPGTLEHWLSERYCLFTVGKDGRVRQTDVHHTPWPLRDADVTIEENTMGAAHGLDIDGLRPDLVMYSPGVDVVVWSPRQL